MIISVNLCIQKRTARLNLNRDCVRKQSSFELNNNADNTNLIFHLTPSLFSTRWNCSILTHCLRLLAWLLLWLSSSNNGQLAVLAKRKTVRRLKVKLVSMTRLCWCVRDVLDVCRFYDTIVLVCAGRSRWLSFLWHDCVGVWGTF